MSIQKDDAPAQQTATAADRVTPSFGADTRSAASAQIGIMDIAGLRRASLGILSVGESVESYKKAFEKIFEKLPTELRNHYVLDVLDRSTDKIFMSSLLISRKVRSGDRGNVVVFALPVESSNPVEDRRQFTIAGQQNEISWAPTDVLDREFLSVVEKYMTTKHGSDVSVVYAGGRVLPQELKSDDEQHLSRLLFEVDQALTTAVEQQIVHASPAVVNVRMFMADNARAIVNVDPTPTIRDNSVGLPVRSDLNIQLRATKNISQQQMNQSLNQRDQDITLTRVDAYVDPIFDTKHLGQQTTPWGQPIADSRRFVPRIMITAVDSAQPVLTPELHLLAISTATALSQNIGNWANSLRPRNSTVRGEDLARLSDIGAVGLVCPLNPQNPNELTRINTAPAVFGDAEFVSLIEKTFVTTPVISLMVEESGERSFLNEPYQFAASGNAEAAAMIVRTADNLTNGEFSKLWNTLPADRRRVVMTDQNRVHLGYFVTKEGRADLLHIDSLAMANTFAEKSPETLMEWFGTFMPQTAPLEVRLATRERLLRNTFNQVTIKGYGRPVTFYNEFLTVLAQAEANAGLSISPQNTTLNDFRTKPQFGMFDPNVFGLTGQSVSQLYSYTQFGNTASRAGIGGMMSGAFGR